MQGHDGLDVVLFGDAGPAQTDGADAAGLRHLLAVAEEAEARDGEGAGQHKAEHSEADPCALAGEDAGGLLQHHLRGEVAEERAGQLQRQHQREVIVGVADEHREQIANDERAAEGEQAQKHGPQRTDGDNVAAALHLASAEQEEGQHRADEAHCDENVEIREAAELDADFIRVIRVPAPDDLDIAAEDEQNRRENQGEGEHGV